MSRYNLVKQFITVEAEEKRVIDTDELMRRRGQNLAVKAAVPDADGFVTGLDAAEIEISEEESGNVIKASEEAKLILEQARNEAEALIEKARTEAGEETKRLIQEAAAQAQSEKEGVLEAARKQGYEAGMAKAQSVEEALRQEYQDRAASLEAEYQRQIDELEPQFVDTITGIYEHIFQVDLSSHREILEHLISSTMHRLEGEHNFVIHVSKEDYSYVNMQKKQMLSGAVSGTDTVDVVEDITLEKGQCLIETSGGIFDCGLDTQLAELRRKLTLLAWTREE